MAPVALVATGATVVSKANSYFYTVVTNGQTCYSTTATYVRIITSGIKSAGGSIPVSLGYDTANIAGKCTRGKLQVVLLNVWKTDPATGYDVGEIALSAFASVNLGRLQSIAFESPIQPMGVTITLHSISFAYEAFGASGSVTTTTLGDA